MPAYQLFPACKNYFWGGHYRLKKKFGILSNLDPLAEAWILSSHPDGPSWLSNGLTFPEFLKQKGKSVLGTNCEKFEQFPILIKLIDTEQNLSIQVHPPDEYALKYEGQYGKTEMWVVLDAVPGAFLYYGFEREISKAEFAYRIENGTLLEILHKVYAKKGDVFFVPPGTIHSIGAGMVIAEIQQNSNVTYRIFDFDRLTPDGKTRALHIEKALAVTNCCPVIPQGFGSHLGQCPYFTIDWYNSPFEGRCDETSFQALLVIDGKGKMICDNQSYVLKPGACFFLPAGSGSYQINGTCQILITYV